MSIVILLVIALVEAGLFVGLVYFLISKRKGALVGVVDEAREHVQEREALLQRVEGFCAEMVESSELKAKVQALRLAKEALKTERGRITITQAERETVEGRLRELEEIERELEASGIETKEELNILQKKEKELKSKNDALKTQISSSVAKIDEILAKVELSAVMQEQVQAMKSQMVQTEQKIDILLLQIEQGNEQYFILKRRYDALDIEYAQLFEKFSESSS
jgi:chromosome segregation ATPase